MQASQDAISSQQMHNLLFYAAANVKQKKNKAVVLEIAQRYGLAEQCRKIMEELD